MGTYQLRSYGCEQYDRQIGVRELLIAEGASYTDVLIGATKARHLTIWRPLWDLPVSLLWRRAVRKRMLRRVDAAKPLIQYNTNTCIAQHSLRNCDSAYLTNDNSFNGPFHTYVNLKNGQNFFQLLSVKGARLIIGPRGGIQVDLVSVE